MNDFRKHPRTAAQHNIGRQHIDPKSATNEPIAEDSSIDRLSSNGPEAERNRADKRIRHHSGAMFGFRMLRYGTKHIKQHIQCEEAGNRRIALMANSHQKSTEDSLEEGLLQENSADDSAAASGERIGRTGDSSGDIVYTDRQMNESEEFVCRRMVSNIGNNNITSNDDSGGNCQQVDPESLSPLDIVSLYRPSRSYHIDNDHNNSASQMITDISEHSTGDRTTKCPSIKMMTGNNNINNNNRLATTKSSKIGQQRQQHRRQQNKLLLVIIYYLTILYYGSRIGQRNNHSVIAVMATVLTTTATTATSWPLLAAASTLNRYNDSTNNRSIASPDYSNNNNNNKRFEYHLNHLQPPARIPLTIRTAADTMLYENSNGNGNNRNSLPGRQARSVGRSQAHYASELDLPTSPMPASAATANDSSSTTTLIQLELPLQLHLRLRPLPLPMPPPPTPATFHAGRGADQRADPIISGGSEENKSDDGGAMTITTINGTNGEQKDAQSTTAGEGVASDKGNKQWLNEARQVLLMSSISAPLIRAARLERRSARTVLDSSPAPPKSSTATIFTVDSAATFTGERPTVTTTSTTTAAPATTTTSAATSATAITTGMATAINESRRQRHTAQQVPATTYLPPADNASLDSNRQFQAMAAAMLPLVWPSFNLLSMPPSVLHHQTGASNRRDVNLSAVSTGVGKSGQRLAEVSSDQSNWPLSINYKKLDRSNGSTRNIVSIELDQQHRSPAAASNTVASFAELTEVATTAPLVASSSKKTPTTTMAPQQPNNSSTSTTTSTTTRKPGKNKHQHQHARSATTSSTSSTTGRRKRRKPNYLSVPPVASAAGTATTTATGMSVTQPQQYLPDSTRMASKYAMPKLKFQAMHSIRLIAAKSKPLPVAAGESGGVDGLIRSGNGDAMRLLNGLQRSSTTQAHSAKPQPVNNNKYNNLIIVPKATTATAATSTTSKSQVPLGLSKLIEKQLMHQINATNLLQNHKAAIKKQQTANDTNHDKPPKLLALAPTTSVSKMVRLPNGSGAGIGGNATNNFQVIPMAIAPSAPGATKRVPSSLVNISSIERLVAAEMGKLHRHSAVDNTGDKNAAGEAAEKKLAAVLDSAPTATTTTTESSSPRHSLVAPPVSESSNNNNSRSAQQQVNTADLTTTTTSTTTSTTTTTTTTTTTRRPILSAPPDSNENSVVDVDANTVASLSTPPPPPREPEGVSSDGSADKQVRKSGASSSSPQEQWTPVTAMAAQAARTRAGGSSAQAAAQVAHKKQRDRIKLFHFKRKPDAAKLPFYKKPLNFTELGWTNEQIQEHLREQLALANSHTNNGNNNVNGANGDDQTLLLTDRLDTTIESSSSAQVNPYGDTDDSADESAETGAAGRYQQQLSAAAESSSLLKRKRRARSQFERLMAELHGGSGLPGAATLLDLAPGGDQVQSVAAIALAEPLSSVGATDQPLATVPVMKKKSEPLVMRPMFFVMKHKKQQQQQQQQQTATTNSTAAPPQLSWSTLVVPATTSNPSADQNATAVVPAEPGDHGSSQQVTEQDRLQERNDNQSHSKPIVRMRRKHHQPDATLIITQASGWRPQGESSSLPSRRANPNPHLTIDADPNRSESAEHLRQPGSNDNPVIHSSPSDQLLLVPSGLLTPSGSHLRPLFTASSSPQQQTTAVVMMQPLVPDSTTSTSSASSQNNNNKQLAAATQGAANEQLRVPKLLSKPMRPAKYSLNGYIPKPSLAAAAAAAAQQPHPHQLQVTQTTNNPLGAVQRTPLAASGQMLNRRAPNKPRSAGAGNGAGGRGLFVIPPQTSATTMLSNKDLDSSTSNEIFSRRRGLQHYQRRSAGNGSPQQSHLSAVALANALLNGTQGTGEHPAPITNGSRQLEENRRRVLLQSSLQNAQQPISTSLSAQKANKIKAKLGLSISGSGLSGGGKLWTPLINNNNQQKVMSSGDQVSSATSATMNNIQLADPPVPIGSVGGAKPLNSIPKTDFECTDDKGKFVSGLFADYKTGCQVWHLCSNNRKYSFLCPSGTIFNAKLRICDWRYNVRCENTLPSVV